MVYSKIRFSRRKMDFDCKNAQKRYVKLLHFLVLVLFVFFVLVLFEFVIVKL
jgi:hypothetical protein